METFAAFKEPMENPDFRAQKKRVLADFADMPIDAPIVDTIESFNRLPYCFTLQCCYGHFVYNDMKDPHNVNPLPRIDMIGTVEYRIAYVAFCLENSDPGRLFLKELKNMTRIDAENIQFGCADWFWQRQVNSYVLQVMPDRFKKKDTAILDYPEALDIEKARGALFNELENHC